MRTNILISKISRLIETAGAGPDGALIAEEYASAVKKANVRLEAVIEAADAKGVSDAIRLLSEDPPLLEEVSSLDFMQFSDWAALCDMNGWTVPVSIDRRLADRAAELGENKDAIAPFLAMYKKAVRVNNVRLAVKSLRRLAEIDQSQNWRSNLTQSERQLKALLVDEFNKAKESANTEECDRIAQELLEGVWQEPPSGKGVGDVRSYRERRDAEKRETLGKENLSILRKCRDEKWDRKLAFSMVQAVDGLVGKGWKIPAEEQQVLSDCRARCASEFEQEERDRRWKEVNEQLHSAIQQEDCVAIRDTLSLPEFLDRDPENNMLDAAQAVLEHAEAARRRKSLQIALASVVGVMLVVGVSGWWLKQKMFLGRCEDAALKLSYLEGQFKDRPSFAIDAIAETLKQASEEDPEVYKYPKVEQFVGRLKALVSENLARTNGLETVLHELEELRRQDWTGAELSSVTSRIAVVEGKLVKEDSNYSVRILAFKNAWLDHLEREEQLNHDRATTFHATLVSHLRTISESLLNRLADEDLKKEVESCRASVREWRDSHSKFAEELEVPLSEAEKVFNEAVESQEAYRKALDGLCNANSAPAVLEARQVLIDDFGNYPEVKALRRSSVEIQDVKDVLNGTHPTQVAYEESLKSGITQEEFDTFLKESVQFVSEAPAFYSLYGLVTKKGDGRIFALSKGLPRMERPSYEPNKTKVIKDGRGLLDLVKMNMTGEIKGNGEVEKPFLMPISDEWKTIIDYSRRSGITAAAFENQILKWINANIEAVHAPGYALDSQQLTDVRPKRGWVNPYCRVQQLRWFMNWLRLELKTMPESMASDRYMRELDNLAEPIQVDGVDEELCWACLWEDRVRRRVMECNELLKSFPRDWVARYRAAKENRAAMKDVVGWRVQYAGKVKFDPQDPKFAQSPDAIVVSAPNVENNHPLYVLRKVGGRLQLVRAFEPGKKAPWRLCSSVDESVGGYQLGEPLYHVFAKGKFIDVQVELQNLAKRLGMKNPEKLVGRIPLF